MRTLRARQDGFAVVVVLLVTMVALGAAVTSATVAALSARTVASDEGRATVAHFAAESGLNTILARSRTPQYAYDPQVHDSFDAWLLDVGLDDRTLPNGSRNELDVVAEDADSITLKSVGTGPDGSTRTAFQDFALASVARTPDLYEDAALLAKDALKTNSKNSRLVGRGVGEDDWRFTGRQLLDAREGEYVVYDGATYRVENRDATSGDADLVPVTGSGTTMRYLGTTGVTLVPFAYVGPEGTVDPPTVTVTDTSLYPAGTTIEVGTARGEVTGRIDNELSVDWQNSPDHPLPGTSLEEGMPIRKLVPSAVTEGGCPSGDLSDKLPQGCYEQPLGDLFANTFSGMSKSTVRDHAEARGAYYSDGAWPVTVDGLTWIDGAKTKGKNNALCGEGVVILNTGSSLEDPTGNINLTTSDCTFRGVLYVIGQLKLVGNLDGLSGAIVAEGPGVTEIQGTGDKSLYDPTAVRDTMERLPETMVETGLYAVLPNTLRYGR